MTESDPTRARTSAVFGEQPQRICSDFSRRCRYHFLQNYRSLFNHAFPVPSKLLVDSVLSFISEVSLTLITFSMQFRKNFFLQP